jgi:hypothetical protein
LDAGMVFCSVNVIRVGIQGRWSRITTH